MSRYPLLKVNREALRDNMEKVVGWCRAEGIDVAGVIKVTNGLASDALDYEASGAKWIASSRLEQLERAKNEGVKLPLMMIRVPMLSEVSELVGICDYSLVSEKVTLKAIDEAAKEAGRKHNVILMADLGDLREGFFDKDELIEAAVYVENSLDAVYLAGIGTNLGCYGSVIPTKENMTQLVEYAEEIEKVIGRKLDIISGGATSSLIPLFDKQMPERINMLRIGAIPHCGPQEDLRRCYGRKEADELSDEAFELDAEVIEVKTKASHPIGKLGVNAFGEKASYVDRGMRKRALLAIGRADYGDTGDIVPETKGAEVLGASGDHTIVDIEDCKEDIKVGDIMRFKLRYSAIMWLSGSENVKIEETGRL